VAIRSLASHLVDVLSGAKLNIWPQALALRLMEEYRLKVLEKGVPRRAFRLRKQNVAGKLRNWVIRRFMIITL